MKTKIDSSAIFHLAMLHPKWLNSFRFSITLKQQIDANKLQQCVDTLAPKYPTICTKISRDFLHYYLEPAKIIVQKDTHPLLRSINYYNVHQQALSILYHENTISLEAFHAITDGHGAITFLKDLLHLYTNEEIDNSKDEISYFKQDGFIEHSTHTNTNKTYSLKKGNYFKFHKRGNHKTIEVTTLEINTNELKQVTKDHECGINEFIIALFYKSIIDTFNTHKQKVAIQIPVNLRYLFPSKSLLNFTLCFVTHIENEEKLLSLKDMAKHLKSQILTYNTKEHFSNEITKIVNTQNHPVIKYLPRVCKTFFLRWYYYIQKEPSCLTITNLGRIHFSDNINAQIEHMDVMISPRFHTPYNCAIISINDTLHINITHDDQDQLVTALKKHFTDLHISVKCSKYEPK